MTPVLFLLAAANPGEEWFETKVRPVFATHCLACHGKTAMGNLRLDQRESAARVIAPGKPDESPLVQAVRRTHARVKMPPSGPLPAEQVDAIVEWVRLGAPWPGAITTIATRDHWAFRPLARSVRPGIDAYFTGKAKPVDGLTWLRRVTIDLTGLPPTLDEIDAFTRDKSREKVVDRLLASPHYGERYARYWLDLARYSDGQLAAGADTPLENAWRYRDWVVGAFNRDLPYDRFIRAQIAGAEGADAAGLGFQALAASAHDQVDTTIKVFLGLTAGCAQCHDHKYDPIPMRDYYSLYGIFTSTEMTKQPLVPDHQVKLYEERKKRLDTHDETISEYLAAQQKLLVDMLARRTADYMMAAHTGNSAEGLDRETVQRWAAYLKTPKEHPYLKPWQDAVAARKPEAGLRRVADEFQKFALELIEESKDVDDRNHVAFGGKKGAKDERTRQYTNIVSLPVLKFYQWRELASGPYNIDGFRAPAGVYYYGAKEIERWLTGFAKQHLDQLRAERKVLEQEVPPKYAFLHSVKDKSKPADAKVHIRGEARNQGEIAPRRFLSALADGEPPRITEGSGRPQLAESIVKHPLAARVIVNRLWQWHFGEGIVKTPSNFGRTGEAPTHPELLEYLAAKLLEKDWSLKAIQREIVLSKAYATRFPPRPRLDLEALRDSILAVSGALDRTAGGPARPWSDTNHRRALYATVSRTRPEPGMTLFDFPDANTTAETRPLTLGPLQGLFFLNGSFVAAQARTLAARLEKEAGADPNARIQRAYRLLYSRPPDAAELALGREAVSAGGAGAWPRYLQALFASAEFTGLR